MQDGATTIVSISHTHSIHATEASTPYCRQAIVQAKVVLKNPISYCLLRSWILRLDGGGGTDYNKTEEDSEPTHPNASQYTITAINMESVHTQFHQLMMLGYDQEHVPDVLVISEHRVADYQHDSIRKRFKDNGWDITMAYAPITNGRAHGGVAIATRGGLRYHRHHAHLPRWTAEGRVLVGALVTPSGRHVCDLLALYGPTDAAHHREQVEELLQDIEAWIAPRHRIPTIILGDFNLDVRTHSTTSRWLSAELLTDAIAQHEDPRPPTHASGTTIDHILATEPFMRLCSKATTQERFTFPTHRALTIDIDMQPKNYLSYLNVAALPSSRLARLKLTQLAHQAPTPTAFKDAISTGNVDVAHGIWCGRWENLLAEACTFAAETIQQKHLGRGLTRTTKTIQPVNRSITASITPLPLRQLLHTVNTIKALIRDELQLPHTWQNAFNWQQRRRRLHRRLALLHGLDFDPIDQLSPERALDELAPRLHQLKHQQVCEARQRWQQKMESYGAACKFVNQQTQGYLDRLQLDDGSWTTDRQVIDEHLRSFWCNQALDTLHDLDDIRQATRRLVDRVVPESDYIVLENLQPDQIQDTIRTLKKQAAPGPGGWHADDLKALPPAAVSELTQLYCTCESRQHFPRLFSESVTTNIPKGPGKARPQDLRPITVFPMLWRVYAKLRAKQLTKLLAPRLSSHQFGAIPGHSVEDVVVNIKMSVDNCYHETGEVHGLQIDIQKCFNNLDHDIALYILQKMGLPPSLAQLWQAQYQRHSTRHRYPGATLGTEYSPPRGIAQGDPLAVLMANAQLSLLPRVLEHEGESLADLQQWWYLDDSTLLGSSQDTIRRAFNCLAEAFATQALKISIPKTVYFVHAPGENIQVGEHYIVGTNRLEILGADIHVPGAQLISKHPRKGHQDSQQLTGREAVRWQKVLPRIKLLGTLGGGPQYRTQLATACIAALWRYAPFGATPHPAQQKGVQRALQVAIFGHDLREAAPEILQSQLLPVHFTHLGYTRVYALLRLLRRAWIQGRLTITTLQTANTPCTYMAQLSQALSHVDLAMENGAIVSKKTEAMLSIFGDASQKEWLHDLRELMRRDLAQQLAFRRPRDFGHCQWGIDRPSSFALWRKTRQPTVTMILRAWHSGSLPFKERQWRHRKGHQAPSPFCTWCWHHEGIKQFETVHHMIIDCPFANYHRQNAGWEIVKYVKPHHIETGILDKHHGLTKPQLKLWTLFQQSVAHILHARNAHLPDLEEQMGSPPAHAKTEVPRYRLTRKQPPTSTCPTLVSPHSYTRAKRTSTTTRMTMIAEEHPVGQWHFNNHLVVALPTDPHAEKCMLLCVRCRRSAKIMDQNVNQALRVIHKRHPDGCQPSKGRNRIDSSLHPWLPREHLKLVAEGSKRSLVCERCGEVSSPAHKWKGWGHRHALCFWLAQKGF